MNAPAPAFYSTEDQQQIALAFQENKPWDADCVHELKKRIYTYHQGQQQSLCCYCQRDQYGEFKLVIDTEHILPKEKYRPHTFDLWNLSVSCKRCNMKIKGQRTDFLIDPQFIAIEKQDPLSYRFIHPNLDASQCYLTRQAVQSGRNRLVKYVVTPGSTKGQYTYEYFRLSELEIDSFDTAQSPTRAARASPTLDEFRALVNQLRS